MIANISRDAITIYGRISGEMDITPQKTKQTKYTKIDLLSNILKFVSC